MLPLKIPCRNVVNWAFTFAGWFVLAFWKCFIKLDCSTIWNLLAIFYFSVSLNHFRFLPWISRPYRQKYTSYTLKPISWPTMVLSACKEKQQCCLFLFYVPKDSFRQSFQWSPSSKWNWEKYNFHIDYGHICTFWGYTTFKVVLIIMLFILFLCRRAINWSCCEH